MLTCIDSVSDLRVVPCKDLLDRFLGTKDEEKRISACSLFEEFVDHMNANAVLITEEWKIGGCSRRL